MRSCTRLLSALALSAGMFLGIAAMAADLPREGTYKGTYAAVGTIKINSFGKDRWFGVTDETGLQVTDGNGFLDHTTWHCWGTADYTEGMGVDQGQCIATDLAGDKILQKYVSEKHAQDQKNFKISVTCIGGTGKYTGASCAEEDIVRGNEFPSAPEGTYVEWVTIDGKYKLK